MPFYVGGDQMALRVGIEPTLTSVSNFLKEKGVAVETVSPNSVDAKTGFDAFVVTGLSNNMIGMHNTKTNAVIIDASGMTPEEVYHELQTRIE
jgi:hypothetical protein